MENIVVVYGSGASHGSGYRVKIRGEQAKKYFPQEITPPTDQNFFKAIDYRYFYALDLDVGLLKGKLKNPSKVESLILNTFNPGINEQNITEEQAIEWFNALLQMPDYHSKVSTTGLNIGKLKLNGEAQHLIEEIGSGKTLEDRDIRILNLSLVKAIYPGVIEDNHEFLKEEYYALWKFKNDFFGSNSNIGMEQVWTALDLNFKHITLGTYNWEKETKNHCSEVNFDRKKYYPNMDVEKNIGRGRFNKYKFLGDAGRDFRRLIYNVYSNYTGPDEQHALFKRLHKSLSNRLLGYITFNYDCYLEDSLNDQFKYVSANSVTECYEIFRHGEVPIIKLHGSLNWIEKYNKPLHQIEYNAPPYSKERQVKPEYINDDEWSQPAIIPPTIFKQEINDDSRTNNFLTQTILQQWRAAITVLQEADIIIFVGYSFPDSDFHSKRIFQIANMLRKSDKKATKILYCEKENKDSEIEDKIKGIFWENKVKFEYDGFEKLVELLENEDIGKCFQSP